MIKAFESVYSEDYVMTKRLCFSSAIVTFNPLVCICASNSPKKDPIKLSVFSEDQLSELEAYLRDYNERPYVLEAEKRIYVAVPSFYPTSTMCLLLRMEYSARDFLRLIKEQPDLFVLSPSIATEPSRMTPRLREERKSFLRFCEELRRAFFNVDRLSLTFGNDEIIDGYCEELAFLSHFFGVPIASLELRGGENDAPIEGNLSLFIAFVSTMLLLVKNEALNRRVSVELEIIGTSMTVRLSFLTESELSVTNETFLWDFLAYDKRMLFEYYCEDGRFFVVFRPCFKDWSYLGIKQERNDDIFFDGGKENTENQEN